MKRILNNPENYVDEMLQGLCAAHGEYYKSSGPQGRVISRSQKPNGSKVGLVSGGGSGHLPIFTGYVGKGLLDACAIGDVFASPTVDQISHAIKEADSGMGVLNIYGNYGGDVMNFDMASEMLEMEDIKMSTVLIADDVVSAKKEEREKRRGTGGLLYAFKAAGAMAESGASLEEVTRVAQKTANACHSMGMAISPCIVPQAGKPTFTLAEDEMEMGMGIHGEPGIWRGKLRTADEITNEIMDHLLNDANLRSGDKVSVNVNSLGATPLEELYIVYNQVKKRIELEGATISIPLVGRYTTSMEMAGMMITICVIDDELEKLLKEPCDCPFLKMM